VTSGMTWKDPEASEGWWALLWIWLVVQPGIAESEGENEEVEQAEIHESKSWYCSY